MTQLKARLVTISVYRRSTLGNWWVGGREFHGDGDWRWFSNGNHFNFTNWAPGKPSDHDNKNCLLLSNENGYKWVDEDCEKEYRYICELV